MTLTEWIDTTGRKRVWVAEQLGITPGWLSQVERNASKASDTLVLLIERVTEGAVTARAWQMQALGDHQQ